MKKMIPVLLVAVALTALFLMLMPRGEQPAGAPAVRPAGEKSSASFPARPRLKSADTTTAKRPPVASTLPAVAADVALPAKQPKAIQDPLAREALSFVGVDAEAERYWIEAINDPSLPASERRNLIEDLNEDGFSNKKNPGPADLPLIVRRLKLIEELAPQAVDEVNAKAFAEAYKDLAELYQRLAGK